MDAAIRIAGLVKTFGTRKVLDGLDLCVEEGEVLALLGPNGAGKTTTIGVLTTLLRSDAGTVTVAGHDVVRAPDAVRGCIALTGQSAAVDDVLTVRENLVMFGRLQGLRGREARVRSAELLSRFGLEEVAGRRVAAVSGGVRRRLDLALSLVVQPQVLFLDEPTTGLDARSRRELWRAIGALSQAGTTVLLTTQYLEEADQLADRIAVMDGGRTHTVGTADELKSRIGGTMVELRGADGRLVRAVGSDGTAAGVRRVLEGFEAEGHSGAVWLRRPSLDDVFLELTDRAPRDPDPHASGGGTIR